MNRSSAEIEMELADLAMTPPVLELKELSKWVGKLQSLMSSARRARKAEKRRDA